MPKLFYCITRQTFYLCTMTFQKIKHLQTDGNEYLNGKIIEELSYLNTKKIYLSTS